MIYGEESEPIDFSQGLWLSDSPDLHTGFCSVLKNLFVTPIGSLIIRPGFMQAFLGVRTFAIAQSGQQISMGGILNYRSASYYPRYVTKMVPLIPNDSIKNAPILFEPHKSNYDPSVASGNYDVRIVNSAIATAGQAPVVSNYFWSLTDKYPTSNYAQYKDKIYAWWESVGVGVVSNWDFTTSNPRTLTRTLVPTSPANQASQLSFNAYLDVYKDRLFLTVGNRVYFTETAAPGGYPETWDIAVNFFTLPVPTVYKTFVFNNILYFFTSLGIWTLQVNGPPESWILKLLTPTVSVTHEQAICLNTTTFYYTQGNAVYAYNGGQEYVKISDPIEEYLEEVHSIGVFAFEDGCLVSTQKYKPSTADPTKATIDSTRVFYFNKNVWTEITMFEAALNPLLIIIGSAVQVAADISNQRPTTYFTYLTGRDSAMFIGTAFVDRDHHMGDGNFIQSPYNYDTDRANEALQSWEFAVSFNPAFNKEKRVKYGYMDILSKELDYEVEFQLNIEGKGYFSSKHVVLEKESPTNDNSFNIQFPVDNYARRLDIKTKGEITWSGLVKIPIKTSPIEIKRMMLVYNTGRSEEKYVAG